MKKRYIVFAMILVVVILILINAANEEPTGGDNGEPGFDGGVSQEFIDEQEVIIQGYDGDAMEPYISRDGQFLFFNNDGSDKDLFYASKEGSNFKFERELTEINSHAVEGVPSMSANNDFYFVSTEHYNPGAGIYSTLYKGRFEDGQIKEAIRATGSIIREEPGWLIMDAEISEDGNTLYFALAKFTGGFLPEESNIFVARKIREGVFDVLDNSDEIMVNINTASLEYAPSVSDSGLELFFTKFIDGDTIMLVAKRGSLIGNFGEPKLIEIGGDLVEGPTISGSGEDLFYHKKDGGKYSIYRLMRGR